MFVEISLGFLFTFVSAQQHQVPPHPNANPPQPHGRKFILSILIYVILQTLTAASAHTMTFMTSSSILFKSH
jgi:hypothetical protein